MHVFHGVFFCEKNVQNILRGFDTHLFAKYECDQLYSEWGKSTFSKADESGSRAVVAIARKWKLENKVVAIKSKFKISTNLKKVS